MAEAKMGISMTTFILGLIIAILASSLISILATTQLALTKGPKGDTGATGPQGLKGDQWLTAFATVYATSSINTSETIGWTNMTGMSVNVTLEAASSLLIMFSAEASNNQSGYRVFVRALVGSTVATPDRVALTTYVGNSTIRYYDVGPVSGAFNFYSPSVTGTVTIKIQWQVGGGTGYIGPRTLTVLAFPLT